MDSRRLNSPISDAKVFKGSRHNSLPQRSIFDVEIVDSRTGISQVLDSLQKRSGPLVFKGLVSLEETKHSTGVKDSLLYIYGEIIEWTHQYNSTHPKRPIFWLKSDGIGWYKIEASSKACTSVTRQYEPYFTPLVKVCSYLDVLVQLVVEMKIKDDMRALVPQVAVLFAEPESKVERMLELHRKQLLDLGASDSIIRGSNFYKKWVLEHASEAVRSLQRQSSRNSIHITRPVHSDTFTNEVTTITDSDDELSNNHGSPSCHRHYNLHEIDNNDFNDTPHPPVARKPPKFYDMADRDIIPILEADVENYEELSAPCGDDICYRHPDFCPLHSVHRTFPHNAIIWSTVGTSSQVRARTGILFGTWGWIEKVGITEVVRPWMFLLSGR
ncbi:hypothetical protein BGX24_006211 [Mortierella sp. AD032]|nr:hypothetical protein BGX24_006211 [Mortierella sp. AD032]